MQGGLLNGRYELHEALGTGGMATVWRGVDRVLARPVAVKVLNEGLAEDSLFAERFAREARHAAMLLHPAIVTVFDSGEDETGAPYLVMELVDGRTLAELLTETPRLPVDRAIAIASTVCDALQVAHAAGLVHRDIKPGNIMVGDDGQVKVVDFGIAKAGNDEAQLTSAGSVLGTASYLAPEQATASEVDARADLYALGCVLTEMLTGQPPFTGATPVEVAWKHVSERPAPLSALRPDITPALDAAVLRLLEKEPGRRPADAATARAELQAAGRGAATSWLPQVDEPDALNRTMAMPPLAAPQHEWMSGPGPMTTTPPAPRRRRRTVLIAAAVAVVAACVVAAVAAQSGPSTPTADPTPSTHATAPAVAPSSDTPTPSPSATHPSGPAAMIAALRNAVAADAKLPPDQQQPLIDALNQADQSLAQQDPGAAGQAIHDAQRVLRKLAKEHAVDKATNHSWSTKLGTISSALRRMASGDSSGSSGSSDGSNNG